MKKSLHLGAIWVFRIKCYWGFGWLFFFVIFLLPTILLTKAGKISLVWVPVIVFLICFIVIVIPLSEIYARMAYKRWFYEFTNDSLKIEKGIVWKKYVTIPYERIQNVDIYRGIIARICGFSTVVIQTAGYSGVPMAEGNIPAVDVKEAERIKNFLINKISKRK